MWGIITHWIDILHSMYIYDNLGKYWPSHSVFRAGDAGFVPIYIGVYIQIREDSKLPDFPPFAIYHRWKD